MIRYCQRCQRPIIVAATVTDFVHDCDSGNSTLDREDVRVIGDHTEDTNQPLISGQSATIATAPSFVMVPSPPGNYGTRSFNEGVRVPPVSNRGQNSFRHVERKHAEYMDFGREEQ